MKIDITDIIERDGTAKKFEMDVDSHKTGGGMTLVGFLGDIHLKGDICNNEGILTVTAEITGQLDAKCYRCLKQIVKPFTIEMEEIFEPANSSENLDNYEYSGRILDISQAVIDSIYLNIPDRVLCVPDCKGLCPNCGCNLNEKECKCKEESQENNKFAALRDLIKE
ncbi:MAG: DUF177 domain-containing protein [Clostridia bacterium]|jgi:uncharacterized protein|nr:DUF177 domain-containing protein [Clostridia bacterium]MDD3092885.1 DUF177 domain-containing protein [Clostridia bacterium]MDD4542306.1 DUF177 domain-containing protein [Clostridia bacterium]